MENEIMKQTEARAMFAKHTLAFAGDNVLVFDKNDVQKTLPLAEITKSAEGAHILLRSPKGKMMKFACVRSYRSIDTVRKAMQAEGNAKPVSEIAVTRMFTKIQQEDFDVAIGLLAMHFRRGVPEDMQKYLTAHAKKTYYVVGQKRADNFSWNRAIRELHGRPEAAEKPATKKPVAKPAAAKPAEVKAPVAKPAAKKPAAKKPVEQLNPKRLPRIKGQKDLGTISDAISKSRTKAVPVPVPEKWSATDEKIYETVMQDLHHLTLRVNEINTARLKGLSIQAYDAQKAK